MEIVSTLQTAFPGREQQIATLTKYIGNGRNYSPPFIYIQGQSATGKTSIMSRIMELVETSVEPAENEDPRILLSLVNCIECLYPKNLLEKTIQRWVASIQSESKDLKTKLKCENVTDFYELMLGRPELRANKKMMIIDNAERIRGFGPHFLPSLLQLTQEIDFHVVLISQIPWESIRPPLGSYTEPIFVHFPRYTKSEIVQILELNCPTDEPQWFFKNFADSIYETFHRNCNNLTELKRLVILLYPKYVQPVFEKQATRHETARLYKLCQPYFVSAVEKLFLRDISSSEWQTKSLVASAKNDPDLIYQSITNMAAGTDIQEYPHTTKYILVSSFISSYNPARLDMQYFAKFSEKKSRGGIVKRNGSKGGLKIRQQLLGPKSFTLSRMLAIMYNILDQKPIPAVDVYSQLSTLVTLKLLIRTSSYDTLENIKYKCNFGYEFASSISTSINFDLNKYLFDFY